MRIYIFICTALFFAWCSGGAAVSPDSAATPSVRLRLLPALQSAFVPGLGQVTEGHWLRGGVILAGEAFLAGDTYYYWNQQYELPADDQIGREFYRNVAYGLGVWYGLGTVFSSLDALYNDAPPPRGSPTWSVIQALLFPGWGQLANGRHWKAAGMFMLQTGLGFAVYYQHQNYLYYKRLNESDSANFYRNDRNRLIWWSVGALIFSAADAYVDCHLRTWDISDDLSWSPAYFPRQRTVGLSLRLSFHHNR